jgi:hypothetical protein
MSVNIFGPWLMDFLATLNVYLLMIGKAFYIPNLQEFLLLYYFMFLQDPHNIPPQKKNFVELYSKYKNIFGDRMRGQQCRQKPVKLADNVQTKRFGLFSVNFSLV